MFGNLYGEAPYLSPGKHLDILVVVHVSMYTYIYTHVHVYVRIHVCMYIYMCVHMYMYTGCPKECNAINSVVQLKIEFN